MFSLFNQKRFESASRILFVVSVSSLRSQSKSSQVMFFFEVYEKHEFLWVSATKPWWRSFLKWSSKLLLHALSLNQG